MHLEKGVGGILSRDKYRGSLVLGRKEVTHQLLRTLSEILSHRDIHQGKSMCSCKVTGGQCCSGSIHQQDGRHSLSGAIQFIFRPMGVVHSSPHGGISPTLTWASKCKSRQGVLPSAILQRLETGSSSFPVDPAEMGSLSMVAHCYHCDFSRKII